MSSYFSRYQTPVPSVSYQGTSPTHPTTGLPGYPAVDIMAGGGTLVVAPETGIIVQESGHDPASGVRDSVYGWSLYLRGVSGRRHYLTHLGSEWVTVGQNVKQGQPLGTIGEWPGDPGRSHLHYGVQGGNAAMIASTKGETLAQPGPGYLDVLKSLPGQTAKTLITPFGVPRAALGLIPGLPDAEDIPIVGDVLSWGEALVKLVTWPFSNWDRILEVLGGFLILMAGLTLAARQMGAPMPRIAGVSDIIERIPAGRLAGTVK